MTRGDRTGCEIEAAVERVRTRPCFTVSDFALLNGVSRNKAYADAAAGLIDGFYEIGASKRISSAPWRKRWGLTPAELTEAA